jgi:glycosyltransferase involved in cell wall biosynthesis
VRADEPAAPRRRVLVLVPELPTRPRSGQLLRLRALVRALGQVADVHVHALAHRARPGPPPWSGVVGWSTSSDPAMGAIRLAGSGTGWLRDPDGHPADAWFDPGAADELRAVLDAVVPEVVVLGGFVVHAYLEVAAASGAVVVLDHQNVEADLADETAALAAPARHVMIRRLAAERTAAREAALVAAVDRIWAVSERDATRLRERFVDVAPVDVVPNVLDELPPDPVPPSRRGSPVLLYPGALSYPPNADAAAWLVAELWPRVGAELPDGRLVIAGADPSAGLSALDDPSVEVTGAVADLDPWFRRATFLPVPLRAGGGTRLKILQAFAHRVPVLTTAKGCEGLAVQPGRHLLVVDDLATWPAAVLDLHRDRARVDQVTAAGRALVEDRYGLDSMVDGVASSLDRCLGRTRT